MEVFSHSNPMFSQHDLKLGLLVILVTFTTLTAACDDLEIIEGTKKLLTGVCVKVYETADCEGFANTKNVSQLPTDTMRGDSVQRPAKLHVLSSLVGEKVDTRWVQYPSLKIKWQSPSSGTARGGLTGFFLWLEASDGIQKECRFFEINHALYKDTELNFTYNMHRISVLKGHNYTVDMYSLPMPNRGPRYITTYMNDPENFQRVLVTTKNPILRGKREAVFPGEWSPGLTVKPNLESKTITVQLSLPRADLGFGFTNYTVGLLDLAIDLDHPLMEKDIYVPAQAIDVYSQDEDNCQCYVMVDSAWSITVRDCKNFCPFSRSAIFDLNGDVTDNPLIATHKPPLAVNDDDDDDDGGGGSSMLNTVMIVIGTAFGVGILAIAGIVAFHMRKNSMGKKAMSKLSHKPDNDKNKPGSKYTFQHDLRVKNVYLMTSSDHEYQQIMVTRFVYFLQRYCKCKVVEPSEYDANRHIGGQASWLADKLSKCELIIFLDSAGAFHRLEEYGEERHYRPMELGPEADLFNLGLIHIHKDIIVHQNSNPEKKAIIVSLTEERCKSRLLGLNEFVLPKFLSSFLQQLHGFGPNMISTYKSQLPLMSGFLNELQGYSELLESIKDVEKYEKQNPEWFSQHFELIGKKKMERFVSNTESESAYGSLTDQRSVTPPPDGSNLSSPTSDIGDNPRFSSSDYDEGSCRTMSTDTPDGDSCFTFITETLSSSHNIKRRVIPPPNELETNSETISTAIGNNNPSISQFRVVGNGPLRQLVPPCNQSDISDANLSMAIGFRNERRLQTTECSNDNQKVMKPPLDDVCTPDSDKFSTCLQDINSDFRKNKVVSSPVPKKMPDGHCRNNLDKRGDESYQGNHQYSIIPPISVISNDDISSALESNRLAYTHDFIHSNPGHFIDENKRNNKNETTRKHKEICPPKMDILSADLDSISCAIGNQNSNFKYNANYNSTSPKKTAVSLSQEEDEVNGNAPMPNTNSYVTFI